MIKIVFTLALIFSVLRNGQYGHFLGYEGHPKCKNTEKLSG